MREAELNELIRAIRPADGEAMKAAEARQAALAKPPHSLGKLEEISIRLAGVTGKVINGLENCRVLVFAADNGVVAQGVAITPQYVTLQQAVNMTKHRTGMSAIASYFGDGIRVFDVGINAGTVGGGVVDRKIARGTDDIMLGPAMSRENCVMAIGIGMEAVKEAALDGVSAVGIGEMGIGNTTTSAAVLAALTGLPAHEVTGYGSGLPSGGLAHKIEVIERALAVNAPDSGDPIGVIAKVGGFDIAAMTGAFLGAALYRIPAVADGFISVVAALAAVRLCPAVKDHLFLSHASKERGCAAVYAELGLSPMLSLDMRLGEGSGCPLAFQIMRAACAAMSSMATFDEAAIDDGYLEELRKSGF